MDGPVQIPLRAKYVRVANSSQPSPKGGNSGGVRQQSWRPKVALKGEKDAAIAVTKANRMVLLVDGTGHRRFARQDSLA